MSNREKMTELHRQSDKLLDANESGCLSSRDQEFVVEFLKLQYTEQLSIIRFGIREVHRGLDLSESEIDSTSRKILFKIQLRPDDATSFGMGTPVGVR